MLFTGGASLQNTQAAHKLQQQFQPTHAGNPPRGPMGQQQQPVRSCKSNKLLQIPVQNAQALLKINIYNFRQRLG